MLELSSMAEFCPAFLSEDFDTAAREADAAVDRLYELASAAASRMSADRRVDGEPVAAWLQRQPEWTAAQDAVQRMFRTRAALEHTGLPLPAEALQAAERAQSDFAAIGTRIALGEIPVSARQK